MERQVSLEDFEAVSTQDSEAHSTRGYSELRREFRETCAVVLDLMTGVVRFEVDSKLAVALSSIRVFRKENVGHQDEVSSLSSCSQFRRIYRAEPGRHRLVVEKWERNSHTVRLSTDPNELKAHASEGVALSPFQMHVKRVMASRMCAKV